jgi:hypothetical protein
MNKSVSLQSPRRSELSSPRCAGAVSVNEKKGNDMIRRFVSLAAVLALTSVALVASPASAASTCGSSKFCAWTGTSYGGTKLIESSAGAGSDHVDVANDQVSSVKNNTANYWCGVNNGFPSDSTVLSVAPRTNLASIGGANNKIDHFYVRSASQGCD